MQALTTTQIKTLLDQDWVVEICGDLGLKSRDRLTYPVDYHLIGNDVHVRNSIGNMISFKVDKSFTKMRQAFSHIIRWETDKKLYPNWTTNGKLFKNSWENTFYARYLFYKVNGRSVQFPPEPVHVPATPVQQISEQVTPQVAPPAPASGMMEQMETSNSMNEMKMVHAPVPLPPVPQSTTTETLTSSYVPQVPQVPPAPPAPTTSFTTSKSTSELVPEAPSAPNEQ